MTLTVRERQPNDLPALAEVLVRVHAQDGYPVEGVFDPQAWLHPARELAAWTAEYDGAPIGHASLTSAAISDDAAAVWHRATGESVDNLAIPVRLFVDPPRRGLGAGVALMRAAQSYASEHNLALVFDVMLKDRAAIRLYESLGCQRIGVIEHRHSAGEIEPAAVYTAP